MNKAIDNEIKHAFPIIEDIQNQELKDTVYRAWARGISECTFNSIEEIPFSTDIPECSLVDHTRWVADAALFMASLVEKRMDVAIDRDLLIETALLHDLGKAFEYKKDGNRYDKTKIGHQFIHGFWGTYISLLEGAPQDLARLVATHCHASPVPPQLLEGVILHYADFAHADILRFQKNMDLFLAAKG